MKTLPSIVKEDVVEKPAFRVESKSEQPPQKPVEESHARPRIKEPTKLENVENNEKRGNSVLMISALGIGVAVCVASVLFFMSRGKSSQSAAPNQAVNQVEQPVEQNAQVSTNQEAVGDVSQATRETAKQPEPAPSKIEQAMAPAANVKGSSESASKRSSADKEPAKTPVPPVVAMVSVPELTGTQLGVAKSILSLNGLKMGQVSTIPDPRNDGMVIRQVPKAGSQVQKGSTINLIVGSK